MSAQEMLAEIGAAMPVIAAGAVLSWLVMLVLTAWDSLSWERSKKRHRQTYPGVMEASEERAAYATFMAAKADHERRPTSQTALRMRHWRREWKRANQRANAARPDKRFGGDEIR